MPTQDWATWIRCDTFAVCVCVCGGYVVSVGAELPEGLDEEPGALVPRPVQSDPHGVLLQQRRETFVDRQVFVALHVKQLRTESVHRYFLTVILV